LRHWFLETKLSPVSLSSQWATRGDPNPSAATFHHLLLPMPPLESTVGTTRRVDKDGGGVAFVHLSHGGGLGRVGFIEARQARRSAMEAARRSRILLKRSSLDVQAGKCARYAHPPLLSSSPPPPHPTPCCWGQTTSPLFADGGSTPRVVVEVIAGSF
jgi:hypothetical protein